MTACRWRRATIALISALLVLLPAAGAATGAAADTFSVATPRGELRVHAYFPENAADAPVWVVMHGLKRNARAYFEAWLPHARERGALLLVPEFDKANWPLSWRYQFGNVRTAGGEAVAREEWAFTAIETAVDAGLKLSGTPERDNRFALYGHGAGAQFVQRYVLHTGGRRLSLAVAANAGWYLLPEDSFEFPYGLADMPLSESALREAFAAPFVLLLGQDDVRTDGVIRRNAQADAQGPHRLARGRYYFERARTAAQRIGVPLQWRLREVTGAGHREGSMMPAAVAEMMAAR